MSMIQNKKADVRHIIVNASQKHRRIDNFIIKILGKVPKSRIYQMLRRGEVRVNGGRIKQDYRLQIGDKVRIPPVYIKIIEKNPIPNDYLINLVKDSLIYENSQIIVVNKPAGVVVHGGSGRSFGIIEILRYLRPADSELQLVHRLDAETSGCLLIAKNIDRLRLLHAYLREGKIEKQYIALLKGQLSSKSIEVAEPMQKKLTKSGERIVAITKQGKRALTKFISRKEFRQATLTNVKLYTGRTHQIRVHADHIQHPVAGDTKYGDNLFNKEMRKLGLKRMFLHASELRIPAAHGKEKDLIIEIPLPAMLEEFLLRLE